VVSTGDSPVVEFRQGDFTSDLRLDRDGFVVDYPGVAGRYVTEPAAG
jgi:hypothetical protein